MSCPGRPRIDLGVEPAIIDAFNKSSTLPFASKIIQFCDWDRIICTSSVPIMMVPGFNGLNVSRALLPKIWQASAATSESATWQLSSYADQTSTVMAGGA